MHGLFAKLGLMLMVVAPVAYSLSCLDPEDVKCEEKSVVEANCTHGVAKDPCDLCWICRRGFGQSCGGIWNLEGTCAEGLYCTNPPNSDDIPGVCCRKSTPPKYQGKTKRQLCPQVSNPCSLEIECEKKRGEKCGGPGNLNGLCTSGLECSSLMINGTLADYKTCKPRRPTFITA